MTETQPPKSDKKRDRQPISIPFAWEEKPGTPKKDWTPTARQIKPVKLVVSVPFGWEEKPGTPLQSFPSHPKHSGRDYIKWGTSDSSNKNEGNDELSDLESDTCSFKTNDLFVSAQSLAATRTASLSGASFLEWLFPLLVQKSKFSNKIENDPSRVENESMHENNCSRVRKPLLTLEELIVMSRRRSCRRKVNRVRKQTSMARGCFDLGSGNGISVLNMKWKRQLQLKFM